LYPMIELLERVALRFEREESPQQKLHKLEGFVVQYGLPLAETVPLFAALLSLPLTADYAPLTLSPEQQKQHTLQAFLTILLRIAARQPVLFVMEDLHWVDPSTLEFLTLLVDQGPTARILTLFTFRPDFSPPWKGRAHLTQVTLPRLQRRQTAEMTGRVAHGKALPVEVVEQVVAKTDGVPLFVEELTKMVLESGLLQEHDEHYELTGPLPPLAIPATLHDSLMARLDRLAAVKGLAQLGATLGREFTYDLLQAVSPWDEDTLHRGLHQLVEAEFLYQRGLLPQATYLFKHALIQEAAYQSLLKSTRQQSHQRIAQVLAEQFPETAETQPELLAHHYTEAGLPAQAIPYWRRAGQRARERSAYVEAIAHLTKGLELLKILPDTPERRQHELGLQTTLGWVLGDTKGYAAPETERAYTRARELCQQVGDTPQLVAVLRGLGEFYRLRGELQTARELEEQCLSLAQRQQDPVLLLRAHGALAMTLLWLGELTSARAHLEQGRTRDDLQPYHYRSSDLRQGALILWLLGYPDQALARINDALTRAQELAHAHDLAFTLCYAAQLHQLRREGPLTLELAEAAITLSIEHGFALYVARGAPLRGWALAEQGQGEAGMAQIYQGLTAWRATGAEVQRPYWLALLAEACGTLGQPEAGLTALAEALTLADKTRERWYEPELYRLKGALLLQQTSANHGEAAACFHQALDVARAQQAKSLELRAAMSLSRLWQQQGKPDEARELLRPIYGWFTEGFGSADLQEAKALLDEWS
jgi:predicted ATPase